MANRTPSLTPTERGQLSQWLGGKKMDTPVPRPIFKATVDGWKVSMQASEAQSCVHSSAVKVGPLGLSLNRRKLAGWRCSMDHAASHLSIYHAAIHVPPPLRQQGRHCFCVLRGVSHRAVCLPRGCVDGVSAVKKRGLRPLPGNLLIPAKLSALCTGAMLLATQRTLHGLPLAATSPRRASSSRFATMVPRPMPCLRMRIAAT